ncbi:MAG: multicopper oxidase family protein [Mycobacteriales bacterium]
MLAERRRLLIALGATLALLAPLGYFWQASLLPDSYSAADMGYLDTGGGAAVMPMHHGRSVSDLRTDPARTADVTVDLTARNQRFHLATGEEVDGYTVNGTSPGPVIRAVEGQLIEVQLRNASVPGGVTLHWHGVDVPNAEDGVAGVTQDAVPVGGSFTYRFVADHAGTYWYHSHQVSHSQVQRGLLGALVVTPRRPLPVQDELALVHVYDGKVTVNGHVAQQSVPAEPGARVRVRVIDTDNGSLHAWATTPYQLVSVDGRDVHDPTTVTDSVLVTAGGRVDLELTMPADGSPVRLELGGAAALVLGRGEPPVPAQPPRDVDLLRYGSPAPLGLDPARATRHFTYSIGRRPGFMDGKPGFWWSINGHLFPDVPMFVVSDGDVVVMTIRNHSGATHPMHLHGHHAVVLSRNGRKATGSPWWVDSLEVPSGSTYEIAFVADNPGIWMDHCHNLPHASQGLVTHLMYDGVTEPFRVGGKADNAPE